jgi:hypothetical protein
MSPEQIAALIEESQTVEPVFRSRVYGYCIQREKSPTIIPSEADVIRMVNQRLSETGSIGILEQIAQELGTKNIRNRSERRFNVRDLSGLVRPYYAGLEMNSSGVLCPLSFYPPITTIREYLRAKRVLEQAGIT